MKFWGGRFTKGTDNLVDEYNASIHFDYQLAIYDIEGSIAHVNMLAHCSLISPNEAEQIRQGLEQIRARIEKGEVSFRLADEDIHMNIERLLHEEIGEVAGKLHSGRSRNDQVALDTHLYLRHQLVQLIAQLHQFLNTIHQLATDHIDTFIPGYTHLQRAEPVRFAHHLLAYFNMFQRDVDRLCASFPRVNKSPLGAGALAGSGLAVDSLHVALQLKLDGVYGNSLDAVSDRDFVIEFLANASLIMMHCSRLSEELILWSSQEFGFIQFDDAFSTGSSMMPQKKNPDVCELARGKTGRVYGALMGLLTTMKGLPLAYNKDMQEDKEGLFDVVRTLTQTLAVYIPMLSTMKVNQEVMHAATEHDYSNATSLANYLCKKQIPFRVAHEITGKVVLYAIEQQLLLKDLPLTRYQQFSPLIEKDIYEVLDIEAVIEAHQVKGGTSRNSVLTQLEEGSAVLAAITTWLGPWKELL
jgi:argininosuccinate lyase